jgi:hypothetical protein
VVFSGYLVSSTNKTDYQNIAEILLEVALNTTTLALGPLIHVGRMIDKKYCPERLRVNKPLKQNVDIQFGACDQVLE